MLYVIGSGPAAVSAAYALAKKSASVTILDVGNKLDSGRRLLIDGMATREPTDWTSAELQGLRAGMHASARGVPLKLLYGSDYPYAGAEEENRLVRLHAALIPSHGVGGLSAVWGAASLQNRQTDIADWPVSVEELRPHYESVAEFMSISGETDGLSEWFPLPRNPTFLPKSQQATALLQDLHRLKIKDVAYGQSRLAVASGCKLCGQCMYGCPYGLIFNSEAILKSLVERHGVRYEPNVCVKSYREDAAGVTIQAEKNGVAVGYRGEAVFLGAGVIPSTRIVLESTGAYGRTVPVHDSQYYLFPLIRTKRAALAAKEKLHTLAQVFLEISDPQISDFSIHLQVYTYNDLYRSVFENMSAVFKHLPLDFALERLLLVQGYLHSRHSSPMQLTLDRDGLRLVGQRDRRVERALVAKVIRKLRPLGFGVMPVLNPQGRGFHSGGTLPMRQNPGDLETDVWGRPFGSKRVHVVDASVLPSIPTTTITFSVMANAHRIASHHGCNCVSVPSRGTVAITGASGYLGSALVRHFRAQGYRVVPLQRRVVGAGRPFVLGEICAPELFSGVDSLVHAAYDFSAMSQADSHRVNVEGTRMLVEAAQKHGVKSGLLVSTVSAFDGCASRYGRIKLECEKIAAAAGYSAVRSALIYDNNPSGMVGALKRLARSPIIPLIGTGHYIQYTVHIDDLCRFIQETLETGSRTPGPLVAANPAPVTLRQILQLYAGGPRLFVPMPVALVRLALRLIKAARIRSRLSLDSLVGLLHPATGLQFSGFRAPDARFRPFGINKGPGV